MNRKVVKWGIVFICFLLLAVIYTIYNPEEYPFFPKCPFRQLTGLLCPGCGSQRTIHYLLNAKIIPAFKENALVVLAIPYIIVGSVFDFLPRNTDVRIVRWRKRLFGTKAIYIILFLIIIFWIGRNLI